MHGWMDGSLDRWIDGSMTVKICRQALKYVIIVYAAWMDGYPPTHPPACVWTRMLSGLLSPKAPLPSNAFAGASALSVPPATFPDHVCLTRNTSKPQR